MKSIQEAEKKLCDKRKRKRRKMTETAVCRIKRYQFELTIVLEHSGIWSK